PEEVEVARVVGDQLGDAENFEELIPAMKKAREAERAPPVAARAPGQREKGRGVGPAAELQLRPAQLREQPRQALDGPALVAEARDPDRAPAATTRTTHFEKP